MDGKPPLFYPAAPEKVAIAAAIRTANSPYHPAPGFPGLDQNRDIKRFRGRQSVSPARQNLVTLACLTPPPAFPAAVAFSRHPWQLAPSDWRIPALSVPDRHPQPPARRHPGSIRAGGPPDYFSHPGSPSRGGRGSPAQAYAGQTVMAACGHPQS